MRGAAGSSFPCTHLGRKKRKEKKETEKKENGCRPRTSFRRAAAARPQLPSPCMFHAAGMRLRVNTFPACPHPRIYRCKFRRIVSAQAGRPSHFHFSRRAGTQIPSHHPGQVPPAAAGIPPAVANY